eukprot:2538743-Pleurochrysis_carterae.AAC.3
MASQRKLRSLQVLWQAEHHIFALKKAVYSSCVVPRWRATSLSDSNAKGAHCSSVKNELFIQSACLRTAARQCKCLQAHPLICLGTSQYDGSVKLTCSSLQTKAFLPAIYCTCASHTAVPQCSLNDTRKPSQTGAGNIPNARIDIPKAGAQKSCLGLKPAVLQERAGDSMPHICLLLSNVTALWLTQWKHFA